MPNPYLPENEYVPDGEPHVFNNRLYVFGSHDKYKGHKFCELDYVCYSASLDDLTNWKYEGIIYKKTQHPGNEKGRRAMYAPDVVEGNDHRFYLYYFLEHDTEMGVAVSSIPNGEYQYLGKVKYKDGTPWGKRKNDIMNFDPGVINDNGRIYLFSGQGPINHFLAPFTTKRRRTVNIVELEDDMLTIKSEPKELIPSARNKNSGSFKGHEFFEASSIRKYNNKYYFIYSSVLSHEIVYAISDKIDEGYVFGGILTSSADIAYKGNKKKLYWYGNNHGSVVEINNKYYIFGHRHTNRSMFSRQGYMDEITLDEKGYFHQAPRTSCGADFPSKVGYCACKASHLYLENKDMPFSIEIIPFIYRYPYIKQEKDYQYIANMRKTATAGFRYVDLKDKTSLDITLRGNAKGIIQVVDLDNNEVIGSLNIKTTKKWSKYKIAISPKKDIIWLGIKYLGRGKLDFLEFHID